MIVRELGLAILMLVCLYFSVKQYREDRKWLKALRENQDSHS
jgi:hypothetical protein